MLVLILMRSLVIAVGVAAMFAIGKILTMVIGNDVILEETFIVEDAPKRRGAREKKKDT